MCFELLAQRQNFYRANGFPLSSGSYCYLFYIDLNYYRNIAEVYFNVKNNTVELILSLQYITSSHNNEFLEMLKKIVPDFRSKQKKIKSQIISNCWIEISDLKHNIVDN